MKISLRTLGAATLLSLTAFAFTPAQAQPTNSDALTITPKNQAVKVVDASSANSLNITMVGNPTPSAQKNTAHADKAELSSSQQMPKIEAPAHQAKQANKQTNKKSTKVVNQKKITTTTATN